MKVTFLLRSDALVKPGGDTTKVKFYTEHLEARGVSCTTIHSLDQLRQNPADILHLLNLDLPLENSYYATQGRKFAGRIVLSTIRHPFAGMDEMFRLGDDPYHQRLRNLKLSSDQAYLLRERVKLASRRQKASLSNGISFRREQARLAMSVDLLLPMAPSERMGLVRDFAPRNDPKVVPNGFSFLGARHDREEPPKYDLVSVGRVEPRKNTLALARAAHAAKLRLLVIGGLNTKHQKFVDDFKRVADTSPYVSYAGPMGHGDLLRGLASARTYINPAWFEVVSQADSEAAAAGLNVISTKYSYATDFLHGETLAFEPSRLLGKEGAKYLMSQFERSSPAEVQQKVTWADAANELFDAYKEVLNVT